MIAYCKAVVVCTVLVTTAVGLLIYERATR